MTAEIQLINHNLDNNLVCQRKDNGYINATALCKACDRKIATYLRAETTKEFLNALSFEVQICTTDLVITRKSGSCKFQGTWVHPYVAINLAQWASPKFAVAVSKWVFDWFNGQKTPEVEPAEQKALPPYNPTAVEMVGEFIQNRNLIRSLEAKNALIKENLVPLLDDYSRITDEQGRTLAQVRNYYRVNYDALFAHFDISQEQIAKFTTSTPLLTIYNAPRVPKLKDAAQEEKAGEEKKPRHRRTVRRGK